jgi:hypothetical protein
VLTNDPLQCPAPPLARPRWSQLRWRTVSLDRDQGLRHLAQADRHIAEAKRRIARQRAAISMLKSGDNAHKKVAESMLEALEGNLRAFEHHRQLILELHFKTDSKSPDQ